MNEVALITVTYKGKELTKLALINKATGNSFVRAVTSLLTEQVKKDTIGGCVKTLAQPLLYFTVLLYFLLAMLLFPHAFGNKLLYSNYIGL